jgi:hypothetical protein
LSGTAKESPAFTAATLPVISARAETTNDIEEAAPATARAKITNA